MRLPQVMGLVFCERFGIDPLRHRVSLEGLFQALRFDRFPTRPQEFTVYAALYGIAVEGTIELEVVRLETEMEIYRYRKWVAFVGGTVHQMEFRVKTLRFPAPGRYGCRLLFEGNLLTERYLDVFRED